MAKIVRYWFSARPDVIARHDSRRTLRRNAPIFPDIADTDESSMRVTSVLQSEAVPFSKHEEAICREVVKILFEIRIAVQKSSEDFHVVSFRVVAPRHSCIYTLRILGKRRKFIVL